MTVSSSNECELFLLADTPVSTLEQKGAGGKACGLARLAQHGFRTPKALVLTGANQAPELHTLTAKLASLGDGPYAVRSSASDEDGTTASSR